MRWLPIFLGFLGCAILSTGCRARLPAKKAALYTDSFDRADGAPLGPDWRNTASSDTYRIAGGALGVRGAHNHPLWLVRELPRDVAIELDAWSDSPDGDIKIELFGDGHSYATSVEYTSSGYVLIHGGWRNRLSALCRQNEHGEDRKTRSDLKVEPGRHYHYGIARHGSRVEWFIDGELALDFDDAAPLEGPAHSYFAFDDWETAVHFDNLSVRPY